MSKLLDLFEKYLVERGYSVETPSGLPSTTYDYAKMRIPKICEREGISVEQLAHNISHYVKKYDDGGSESKFGNKSHRAFINALKRFEEFIKKGGTIMATIQSKSRFTTFDNIFHMKEISK